MKISSFDIYLPKTQYCGIMAYESEKNWYFGLTTNKSESMQ